MSWGGRQEDGEGQKGLTGQSNQIARVAQGNFPLRLSSLPVAACHLHTEKHSEV